MSAETLRKAAALMRQRAEAATPGPWIAHTWGVNAVEPKPLLNVVDDGDASTQDLAHIASWHPDVALAAAVWLDSEAELGTYRGQHHPAALAFARAYLGEVAR